jgi:DNA modification methylase
MDIQEFKSGVAICGTFPHEAGSEEEVMQVVDKLGPFNLAIIDPPYGEILNRTWDKAESEDEFVKLMFGWLHMLQPRIVANGAVYWWGGIGKPKFRPLYKFASQLEHESEFLIADHITWRKRRAYGKKTAYLFVREEVLWLIRGDDIKHPLIFNIPYLEKERGYEGYNKKYPAKSKYLRRPNVWDDVTEILRGKLSDAQKPVKLYEIIINAHTNPGDTVFDGFAGSGTTAIAAMRTGRHFVVVEEDPVEFAKIVKRIRDEEAKCEELNESKRN